jgi:hypothetical protein
MLLIGLFVVDADIALQKRNEVKHLLDLATHHATFAVNPELKTEGIIELVETEAVERFLERMHQNGRFTANGRTLLPSSNSVTENGIAFWTYYVDFQSWQRDHVLSLRYDGEMLHAMNITVGSTSVPSQGGLMEIQIRTDRGETLRLPSKRMSGPSWVVAAYVNEPPLFPLVPAHSFPLVSVEQVKW